MGARLRSWWQKIQQQPVVAILAFVGSMAGIAGIALIVVVVLGYWLNWHWTGLVAETSEPQQHAKTLWDWLGLIAALGIPVVVGFGAALFTAQQAKVSERENTDNQREAALQAYIDKISELLLKEHLGERTADGKLKPEYEQVRNIARVRTITVLTQLDARRVSYVFAFLREAGLMSTKLNDNVVSVSGADLRKVNWSRANLSQSVLSGAALREANLIEAFLFGADLSRVSLYKANLSNADLTHANLREAWLEEANLYEADLMEANLSGANLTQANLSGAALYGTDLTGANLTRAIITEGQLKQAKSLKGATLPNGAKHP